MSQGKMNKKEWETWMDNLIIEKIIQKENIPFYQYSEFQNVKFITANIFIATFKSSQKTVTLKCISLNDKFTLDNLINENSENIHIHNGIIKFNVFGLTKIVSDSLSFLPNNLGPIQYMDPQHKLFKNKSSDIFGLGIILWEISSGSPPFEMDSSLNVDLLNDIVKGKREMTIPGTPHKYKEIYSDCWKHSGNSRPDISQVVKNLSEIIISDASSEFGTSQSQPYNFTDVKLENLIIQNEKFEIRPHSPFFDVTTEVNVFIKDLFDLHIDLSNSQFRQIRPILLKNHIREHKKNPVEIFSKMISHPYYHWFTSLIGFFYHQFRQIRPILLKNHIREHKKNPVEIFSKMISHPYYHWFTSLIGFFYQYGIGTVADYQMAFKFFNLGSNQIIDTSSSNSSLLRKLYNINKEISTISLANMHFDGLGVEVNTKKAFQIFHKLANKGSLMALNNLGYCYNNGSGVEKNEEKAFKLYLKSAEKGFILAQFNVGWCYGNGIGITKDEAKGFQWVMKSARAGNINAMCNVGHRYDNGIGVCKDEKEAFNWYLKAAEKEHHAAQYNLGWCYKDGDGINRDYKKAFEWFKKAAENNFADSQYMLGKFFYEGNGTKKDIVNSIYWLNRAKENGETDNELLLEEIFSNMI
ncbi:hypothetical protein Glove_267g6 [Diversispora epigaea]|uniref:Protein kinase domain-containing protein n=1 Tax=Diversispora epigaea TaxID=1348612 RepID=A0A397I539_9GLOM|nr:hypothetical protein Glove_267g6 [Diversispora epigaea]